MTLYYAYGLSLHIMHMSLVVSTALCIRSRYNFLVSVVHTKDLV